MCEESKEGITSSSRGEEEDEAVGVPSGPLRGVLRTGKRCATTVTTTTTTSSSTQRNIYYNLRPL